MPETEGSRQTKLTNGTIDRGSCTHPSGPKNRIMISAIDIIIMNTACTCQQSLHECLQCSLPRHQCHVACSMHSGKPGLQPTTLGTSHEEPLEPSCGPASVERAGHSNRGLETDFCKAAGPVPICQARLWLSPCIATTPPHKDVSFHRPCHTMFGRSPVTSHALSPTSLAPVRPAAPAARTAPEGRKLQTCRVHFHWPGMPKAQGPGASDRQPRF